jgi:uncharacterized protein (TIGR03437 family)
LAAFDGLLYGQALFQKPVKVLGDPSYIGTANSPNLIEGNGPNVVEGREFSGPAGIALDNSVSPPIVYIADSGNNRVLGYKYATQLSAGSIADVVVGQVDRFSNLPQGPGTGRSTGLNRPTGIAVDASGNLYVADTLNNRVLRFPHPMSQPGGTPQLPDLVIGQTSFNTSGANAGGIGAATLALGSGSVFTRGGVAFDSGGNLWVADTFNNRVLRFPASVLKSGGNGPSADLVVGQPDFVTTAANTTRTSKIGLNAPQGVAFDPTGRLFVADSNFRVMVYGPNPSVNAPAAIRIAGVDTVTTPATQVQLAGPLGVGASSVGVFVADTANNRVMVFPSVDAWPTETTQFSPSATAVVGQTSYTVAMANQGMGDASAATLAAPLDVALSSTELFVADAANNRVLAYSVAAGGVIASATRVTGQLDFPYSAPNLIEGKEFDFSLAPGITLSGSAVIDQSVYPPHLYVADTQNNRILGFNDFTKVANGLQAADLVIGQPDFHRNLINYPSNKTTMPNQQGLNQPTSLAVDSAGNLYVADTGNSRVLRFPAPYQSGTTSLEKPDLVIGQTSFTVTVTDATAQTLNTPAGIALTADAFDATKPNSGWLVVSDSGHNRVLFFPKPFTIGMSATKVLGSLNFTTTYPGSSAPQQFNSPRGVTIDPSDRVAVADTANHRLQIFNAAATINNYDTPPVSVTSSLSSPISVAASAAGFWVADAGAGQLFHYQVFNQLVIGNKSSDMSIPAIAPVSAFSDNYGNLLVCDGANRVLYYAPQATSVSAATYSPRAVSGGMYAAIFPTVMTNIIAAGTAAATSVPLPNALADTQALVNGSPVPLYYVSPGQINLQLPSALPGGGTADLRLVRQSTGQVYAGAELQLASADPGIFTANGSGGGPAVAVNFVDGSVNSASNPVARGQYLILYATGQGAVVNGPPDGQAATGPTPTASMPQVLLGSSTTGVLLDASNIQYSGLAPSLVGIWQLNLLIPSTAPTGTVPITIFQNSVPSNDRATVVGATTIAIK